MSTTLIVTGFPGTGSSTVAQMLVESLGYEYVYAGGILRAMAKERGQTIDDFLVEVLQTPHIDRTLDEQLLHKASEGNVIIESRTLPWLLKTPAYKVWLTCERPEQIRRLSLRGPEGAAEAARIDEREAIERDRYRALYGFDMADLSVFDLVIDTTAIPADEVAQRILQAWRA